MLVDWANRQDGWVRAIVAEAVLTRKELSPAAVDRVTDAFLVEKQLQAGELPEAAELGDPATAPDAAQTLELRSLRDCHGVNALVEDQGIDFNPRMTILFGENATGKTGYVRVLKRVANVRSAEEIIPDIHRATHGPQLEAVLDYAIDGDEVHLEWSGETGVFPLTRMSIFDTPAVALHLDDDLTYVYTPPDLALFRYVHSAIDAVRGELDRRRAETDPRQNPFITAFARGSDVYPKIEQLGASTDLADLRALATLDDGERAEIETLKTTIEALSGESTAGHAEMLRNRVAVLRAVRELAAASSAYSPEALEIALGQRRQAHAAKTASAGAVALGVDLPEDVRPAWHAFLEAGDRYLHLAGQAEYPSTGDDCIYCKQPLDADASALLVSYRDFASGAATAAAEAAREAVERASQPLAGNSVTESMATLETLLPAIEEGETPPEWANDARALLDSIRAVRDELASEEGLETAPLLAAMTSDWISKALTEAEEALRAVDGDAHSRRELLTKHRARLADLEARAILERLIPEITVFVQNAAWAGRLKLLLNRFQGLLKSLTDVSKAASESALNEGFRQAFYEECRALRAPNVELGFPGRRGQAARRKTVAADHSLSEVLSEGEQKVIAVADFLAEASFRGGSAPLVFDDPVTSLDYRRLHEMVDRITSLSEDHQVVVFTHNIWFASELLAQFDSHPADCSFFQVTEQAGLKGVITGGAHPRIDTPAKIRGRINAAVQEAKAAGEEDRPRMVEATYDHIRAWCEAVVEADLLGKVTKRYQANVAMQNLELIKPDKLGAAIAVILPIYERACRYIPGHSQPLETLDVRPSFEELELDWKQLQDARTEYTS